MDAIKRGHTINHHQQPGKFAGGDPWPSYLKHADATSKGFNKQIIAQYALYQPNSKDASKNSARGPTCEPFR